MSFVVSNKWYLTTDKSLAYVEGAYTNTGNMVLFTGYVLRGIGKTKLVWDENGVVIGNDPDNRIVNLVDDVQEYLLREHAIIAKNFKDRGDNLNKTIERLEREIQEAKQKDHIYSRLAVLEKFLRVRYGDLGPGELMQAVDDYLIKERNLSWIKKFFKWLKNPSC